MRMIRQVAAIAAGVIGFAVATPIAALPAVQVFGPSEISVGDTLELRLNAIGEGYPELGALTVNIAGPAGVFDGVLGPLSARLADGSVLPASWLVEFFAEGADATAFAAPLFDPPFLTDIPNGGGPLLALSFPVLAAPTDPLSLSFSVDFNNDNVTTDYRVTINAVPEPGTIVLLLAGLGVAVLSRRARKPA